MSDDRLETIANMIEEFMNKNEENILVSSHNFISSLYEIATQPDLVEEETCNCESDEVCKECFETEASPGDKLFSTSSEKPGKAVQKDKVIISCDASVKENPGGPAAVGIVIQYKKNDPMEISTLTKATTNNQAEYDAVYVGLKDFFSIINNPGMPVEVRSDSRLVVQQLKRVMNCNDKVLETKRDLILELISELPVEINFVWRPRNSTPELKLANNLAQDALGVPRH